MKKRPGMAPFFKKTFQIRLFSKRDLFLKQKHSELILGKILDYDSSTTPQLSSRATQNGSSREDKRSEQPVHVQSKVEAAVADRFWRSFNAEKDSPIKRRKYLDAETRWINLKIVVTFAGRRP